MGYTADQIVVEGIPVEHLEDMEFVERAGEHGCLTLRGIVKEENGEPLGLDLAKLSPNEYYQYWLTDKYPINV